MPPTEGIEPEYDRVSEYSSQLAKQKTEGSRTHWTVQWVYDQSATLILWGKSTGQKVSYKKKKVMYEESVH